MQVTTIGLDLAKNVFQVHGITENEEVAFNKPLRRAQLLPFFSKIEPCLIGMEACSSAHHWARELTKFGHDVRLIPPMYVKPYVKRGKSDAIDAEAICEAVTRPTWGLWRSRRSNSSPYCQSTERGASWFASAPNLSMVYVEWLPNLVCISRKVSLGSSVLPRTYWLAKF